MVFFGKNRPTYPFSRSGIRFSKKTRGEREIWQNRKTWSKLRHRSRHVYDVIADLEIIILIIKSWNILEIVALGARPHSRSAIVSPPGPEFQRCIYFLRYAWKGMDQSECRGWWEPIFPIFPISPILKKMQFVRQKLKTLRTWLIFIQISKSTPLNRKSRRAQ